MKTYQKIEVGAALTSLIFAILEFVFLLSHEMQNEVSREAIGVNSILIRLVWHILPVFLMAVGSFSQIFRKSWIGLITVILFGLVTILMKAFIFFVLRVYDVDGLTSLALVLSGVLAMQTIIFAICSRKFDS